MGGRYRKVAVRIWNDEKFRALSDDGKLVFLFLLTHPQMTSLGAMRATMEGLAKEMGWLSGRLSKGFAEASGKGMAKHDPEAGIVVLPNFLRHNPPENPNVVKSWRGIDDLLPECQLKTLHLQQVMAFLGESNTSKKKRVDDRAMAIAVMLAQNVLVLNME